MKKTSVERFLNFFGVPSQPLSEQAVSVRPVYNSEQAIRESISHGAFGPLATTVCVSYTDLDYLAKHCGIEINALEARLSTALTNDQKLAAYQQFVTSVQSHGFILNEKRTFIYRIEQSQSEPLRLGQ